MPAQPSLRTNLAASFSTLRQPKPNNPTIADIYFSACSADLTTYDMKGLWVTGTIVPALSSPYRDTRMATRRRDGLEIILSSGRTGSLGN